MDKLFPQRFRTFVSRCISVLKRYVALGTQCEYDFEHAMLRGIIELNPYGISIWDKDGHIVEYNQAWLNIFKVAPPPTYSIFDYYALQKMERPEEFLRLKEGEAVTITPFWFNTREVSEEYPDNPVCVAGVAFPLFERDGTVRSYVAMHEDVTKRELAKKALREALEVKSNFMATMSHELRSPLAGIIACADVMLKDAELSLPRRRIDTLKCIMSNSDKLLSMIEDVLSVARIDAGRVLVKCESFALAEVMTSSIESFQSLVEAKGLKMVHEISTTLPTLYTDREKVRCIVTNLIGNAVKFTDAGEVKVVAHARHRNDGNVVISVSDTGIGIAPEMVERIFDQFEQADTSPTRRYGGMGLGLSIVKSYVNMLKGSIDIQSVPGKGSTFTVVIPATLP